MPFSGPGRGTEIACSQLEGSWLWAQRRLGVLAQAWAQRSPQQMAAVEDTWRLSRSHGHLWEGLTEARAQATAERSPLHAVRCSLNLLCQIMSQELGAQQLM